MGKKEKKSVKSKEKSKIETEKAIYLIDRENIYDSWVGVIDKINKEDEFLIFLY